MNDFHSLFSSYAGDIYHFALFLCGDKVEAEEITAETFARAITGKAPLRTSTAKGYLLTIARNLHIESVRRQKRFSEIQQNQPDSSTNVEHMVNQKTELEDVQAYLQKFSDVDRAALLLRADGLSYDEISDALNISKSSAKVKVHRLRMNLIEWQLDQDKS